jgi:SAM-dependent methyltransferase
MRYTNVVCEDCGLVYLAPRPSPGDFGRFYEELYPRLYGKEDIASAPTVRGREVVSFLRETGAPDGRRGVLDAGCGDGGVVLALLEDGVGGARVTGCDPGWPGTAELELGGRTATIVRADVEELGPTLPEHDLVLMYDVVEHLLDPAATLALLREAGGDDARLFVSTSCLDNWREIPPHGWESYYLRLAHTYTFTRRTLQELLAKAGWAVDVWRAAPRGDQWVLARAAEPRAAERSPEHAHEVERLVAQYAERSR